MKLLLCFITLIFVFSCRKVETRSSVKKSQPPFVIKEDSVYLEVGRGQQRIPSKRPSYLLDLFDSSGRYRFFSVNILSENKELNILPILGPLGHREDEDTIFYIGSDKKRKIMQRLLIDTTFNIVIDQVMPIINYDPLDLTNGTVKRENSFITILNKKFNIDQLYSPLVDHPLVHVVHVVYKIQLKERIFFVFYVNMDANRSRGSYRPLFFEVTDHKVRYLPLPIEYEIPTLCSGYFNDFNKDGNLDCICFQLELDKNNLWTSKICFYTLLEDKFIRSSDFELVMRYYQKDMINEEGFSSPMTGYYIDLKRSKWFFSLEKEKKK